MQHIVRHFTDRAIGPRKEAPSARFIVVIVVAVHAALLAGFLLALLGAG